MCGVYAFDELRLGDDNELLFCTITYVLPEIVNLFTTTRGGSIKH